MKRSPCNVTIVPINPIAPLKSLSIDALEYRAIAIQCCVASIKPIAPLKYLLINALENKAIAMQCCVAPTKAIAPLKYLSINALGMSPYQPDRSSEVSLDQCFEE